MIGSKWLSSEGAWQEPVGKPRLPWRRSTAWAARRSHGRPNGAFLLRLVAPVVAPTEPGKNKNPLSPHEITGSIIAGAGLEPATPAL